MFLKINVVIKESEYSTKIKKHFDDTLSRRTYFWDTAVPCGSENSHNVLQLNPDEDKYYLLTPYPTLLQPLKKFYLTVLELLPATRISFYNRSTSTLYQTDNTRFVHNNFRDYLQKWTQYNDNQYIRFYANLRKQQDFKTFTHKITADNLKILKITFI